MSALRVEILLRELAVGCAVNGECPIARLQTLPDADRYRKLQREPRRPIAYRVLSYRLPELPD